MNAHDVELIAGVLAPMLDELRAENAQLRARVTALEGLAATMQQRGLADFDRGIWRQGETYKRNDVCSDRGAAWLALVDTDARPGSSGAWRLIAKAAK
jgi:hypothetical protein